MQISLLTKYEINKQKDKRNYFLMGIKILRKMKCCLISCESQEATIL